MNTIAIQRARAVPLESVLKPFGAQRAPNGPTPDGKVGGSRIRAGAARFYDRILEASADVAIALACHPWGRQIRAVAGLRREANRLGRTDRVPTPPHALIALPTHTISQEPQHGLAG